MNVIVPPSPRGLRALPAVALAAVLAGCAAKAPAPVVDRGAARPAPPAAAAVNPAARAELYTVQRGDTLFSIARAQGVEYRELVQLNQLADPSKLEVGQVLRLRPPQAAADAGVQVRPIAGTGPIETRPLGSDATKPGAAPPVVVTTPGASPSPEARVATVKSEPRAQKLPYSDEALAALQRSEEMRPVAPVVPAAGGAKPDAVAKAEPSAAKPDAGTPAKPDAGDADRIDWAWPSTGRVLSNFTEANKGIDIAGRVGDPVYASAGGKVVYSGSGLRGYGNLIIIAHRNNYLSAYAHNSKILVKEGQQVSKGQKIAEVGNSDADQPKLHFEIRREGKPLDPSRYLPER
jgi:lipoprotein NlpD